MLRDSANEIRLHPGRFVATLMAIAISVGFIAAISTVVATESAAMARSNVLPVSRADVVVEGYFEEGTGIVEAIEDVEGVRRAAPAGTGLRTLAHGDRTVFVTTLAVPPEELRWAELVAGQWPGGPDEVTMSADGMDRLGVRLGDEVSLGDPGAPTLRVVGQTDDARSRFSVTTYVDESLLAPADASGLFAVALDEDADASKVIASVAAVLPEPTGDPVVVASGDEARQGALNDTTSDVDVFSFVLYGFAGIALVVGMIIISNTFAILVAQRRRQIGLLRAVGASTGQVRGRLVTEAVLLGLGGSVLGVVLGVGVAVLVGVATGSLFWGLELDPVGLAVAVLIGLLATLGAVLAPAVVATRVTPLEALQPVPSAAGARRSGVLRAVVCGALLLAGAGLAVLSRSNPDSALAWGIAGGALIAAGVLGAAPLYVAPLLRGVGHLVGRRRPTLRLAAQNAARSPGRAAATTVALMLAVGLVVTLQVAVATMRTTGMAAIDQEFPQDLVASSREELPADYIAAVEQTPGAARVLAIASKTVEFGDDAPLAVRNVNPARAALDLPSDMDAADGDIIVNRFRDLPEEITLDGVDGPLVLTVKKSASVTYEKAAVSARTFAQLAGEEMVTELWVKLTDRRSPTVLNDVTRALETGRSDLLVEGGAVLAGSLEDMLDVILAVLTALLGVAVVIALVGVGNTLGLSVIERQRESALLRALGMQQRGLRLMLLAEAMMLALLGTLIGIAAGAFFGWLGVSSALLVVREEFDVAARFAIDVPMTLGLILVCLVAAALASVLPGRRAARATPTEALAVE